jgi:multiple sugar transport system substrate-binding protein
MQPIPEGETMETRRIMQNPISRRRFLGMSAGAGMAAFLAACTTGGAAPAAPQAAAGAAAGAAAAAGGLAFTGDLTYWDWNYDERADLLARYTEEWQAEHPGITIVRESTEYADAQTKLLTAASAGSNPPFANIHSTWRPAIQRQGLLAPYPEDLLPFDQMLSTPFNTDPNTGRIYTCTFNYYCDLLVFNTALLEAEGMTAADVPNNWDDYMKFIEQMTKRDASGNLVQPGMTLNHYYSRQWLWQTLVYQQGEWLYNEDGTEAQWNSDAGIQALQMIKDVYFKHKADDVEFLSMWDAFGTGVAASYISQGYTTGWDRNYPDVAGKWGTTTTPTFSGGNPDFAWGMVSPEEGMGVFANATPEEQEAAFSFIQSIIGPDEHVLDWAVIQGGPPDRTDLLDAPRLTEEDRNGVIQNQGVTMPWRVNPGEQPLQAEKHWRVMFDRILLENAEPKDALDEATANFNAELKASGDTPLISERAYTPPAN